MNLEQIIRPFQRLAITPGGQHAPSTPGAPAGANDVFITVSDGNGAAKTMTGTESTNVSFYMDTKHNEEGNDKAGGGGEHQDKMQDHKDVNDHTPARLMVITRTRNTENPTQYHDEVLTVATLQKTGRDGEFQRWVLNTSAQKFGDPDDTSAAFIATEWSDIQSELSQFKNSHEEQKVNLMMIMRIRNSKDKDQYVDEAKTVGYRVVRTAGPEIEVMLPSEKFQIAKEEDRSDVFEVQNDADLQAQVDIFKKTHPR